MEADKYFLENPATCSTQNLEDLIEYRVAEFGSNRIVSLSKLGEKIVVRSYSCEETEVFTNEFDKKMEFIVLSSKHPLGNEGEAKYGVEKQSFKADKMSSSLNLYKNYFCNQSILKAPISNLKDENIEFIYNTRPALKSALKTSCKEKLIIPLSSDVISEFEHLNKEKNSNFFKKEKKLNSEILNSGLSEHKVRFDLTKNEVRQIKPIDYLNEKISNVTKMTSEGASNTDGMSLQINSDEISLSGGGMPLNGANKQNHLAYSTENIIKFIDIALSQRVSSNKGLKTKLNVEINSNPKSLERNSNDPKEIKKLKINPIINFKPNDYCDDEKILINGCTEPKDLKVGKSDIILNSNIANGTESNIKRLSSNRSLSYENRIDKFSKNKNQDYIQPIWRYDYDEEKRSKTIDYDKLIDPKCVLHRDFIRGDDLISKIPFLFVDLFDFEDISNTEEKERTHHIDAIKKYFSEKKYQLKNKISMEKISEYKKIITGNKFLGEGNKNGVFYSEILSNLNSKKIAEEIDKLEHINKAFVFWKTKFGFGYELYLCKNKNKENYDLSFCQGCETNDDIVLTNRARIHARKMIQTSKYVCQCRINEFEPYLESYESSLYNKINYNKTSKTNRFDENFIIPGNSVRKSGKFSNESNEIIRNRENDTMEIIITGRENDVIKLSPRENSSGFKIKNKIYKKKTEDRLIVYFDHSKYQPLEFIKEKKAQMIKTLWEHSEIKRNSKENQNIPHFGIYKNEDFYNYSFESIKFTKIECLLSSPNLFGRELYIPNANRFSDGCIINNFKKDHNLIDFRVGNGGTVENKYIQNFSDVLTREFGRGIRGNDQLNFNFPKLGRRDILELEIYDQKKSKSSLGTALYKNFGVYFYRKNPKM
ncbi:hypothetical protein AYI68_g1831 [Smittium mucronatum]|uniref:Uncharacterized protein n=1 Tax=Smittium mucronatum TaxID=133383 RepID=A0A1R0H4F4_9FUNG|nr:hypothetical protein AYI68_g1831 [Smittium mucronatum]